MRNFHVTLPEGSWEGTGLPNGEIRVQIIREHLAPVPESPDWASARCWWQPPQGPGPEQVVILVRVSALPEEARDVVRALRDRAKALVGEVVIW